MRRFEHNAAILAGATSPLWFINLFGVNIGIDDLLFTTTAALLVIRNRSYLFAPTKVTGVAVGGFLLAATISVGISPLPLAALLNYLQYLLIFVVVVPAGIYVFEDRQSRWMVFLLLICIIDFITLVAVWERITAVNQLSQVNLWYANRNQLFWIITSGAVLNCALLSENFGNKLIKACTAVLAAIQVGFAIWGVTLSAWLLLGGSGYLMIAYFLNRKKNLRKFRPLFYATTALLAITGVALVFLFWDFVYLQGNLYDRTIQYETAVRAGLQAFPFGTGLESSEVILSDRVPEGVATSIHNVIFAHFLELGLLGLLGFTLILLDWAKSVLITMYTRPQAFLPYEVAFVAIFSGYILVMLFQPVPVTRFWWVMFSLSWGAVLDLQLQLPLGIVDGAIPRRDCHHEP